MSCRDSGINQTDVSDGLPHSQRTPQDPLFHAALLSGRILVGVQGKDRAIENEREKEGGRQSVIRRVMSLKIRGQLSNLKKIKRKRDHWRERSSTGEMTGPVLIGVCENITFTVHASVETPQSKYIYLLIPKLRSKT